MTQLPRYIAVPLLALLALVCATISLQAQAFYLSGSFSGVAQAELLPLNFPPPHPASYYDGATVTGRFSVDVREPQFQVGGEGYAYFLNGNGGSLSMSYTIKDVHFDFVVAMPYAPNGPSVVLLASGDSSQSVSFLTDLLPKYQGAEIDLTGAPGALFTGLDATTLHIDKAMLPAFGASFASAAAEIRVGVEVDKVIFQTTRPVPEPGTLALTLAGGGWLAWRRRRSCTASVCCDRMSDPFPLADLRTD